MKATIKILSICVIGISIMAFTAKKSEEKANVDAVKRACNECIHQWCI